MTRCLLLGAAALCLAGCGVNPGRVDEPVPVQGQVKFADGKPVVGVILTLQPVDSGMTAGFELGADGSFSGQAVPGKYAYFFTVPEVGTAAEKQKAAAALKAIPEQYRSAHMDRTVVVTAGGDLQINLN